MDPSRQALLARNLASVRARLAAACRRAGRAPEGVRLVAVTKYVDADTIGGLLALGALDLGENRAQQLEPRAAALGASLATLDADRTAPPAATPHTRPRWHMIGHVQRNKVRKVLAASRIIHSVDSLRLAEDISRIAGELAAQVDVLVEINVSGEASKQGVPSSEAAALVERIGRLPHLALRGLMTMAPLVPDPETVRPIFAALRELGQALRACGAAGPQCDQLSMGMTNDFEVAVEEGATIVRIGSALYEGLADVV